MTSRFAAWILAASTKHILEHLFPVNFHPEDLHIIDCELNCGFFFECQIHNCWRHHDSRGASNSIKGTSESRLLPSVLCESLSWTTTVAGDISREVDPGYVPFTRSTVPGATTASGLLDLISMTFKKMPVAMEDGLQMWRMFACVCLCLICQFSPGLQDAAETSQMVLDLTGG